MSYPPPPVPMQAQNPYQTYSKEQVEEIRRQRISYVKRNAYISLGLQIAFTAVFAALLGYYINRQRNLSRYDDSWFRWYIGLLIALLVIDLLCIAYTYWQMVRKLRWLREAPDQVIVSGDSVLVYISTTANAQPIPNGGAYNYGHPQPGFPQPGQASYNPPSYPPPAQNTPQYPPDTKNANDHLHNPFR
ncbi:hypothetical protein FB645_002271 [Coemansia sp. IMI 203386]|nr:hypothetical protein FB645_002271 [Coemansia sp. IMI 203386]